MHLKYLLSLLGLTMIALGVGAGKGLIPVVWLGVDFLALGLAHASGAHRIVGKRFDGSLSPWSWLFYLPLLTFTILIWHLTRLISREPASNVVTEDLVVGRRHLSSELPRGFDNYVDLTAEFAEPRAIRRNIGYISFPILDGGAPKARALRDAVAKLRPGRTFIHCAQGHGRTGMFALAVLLSTGATRNVDEGLRMLRTIRPGIRLNREQRRCIEEFAETSH